MTDTIKRHANGSIDTAHYMKLGRQARSNEAYRLGRATRATSTKKLAQLREAVAEITASSAPAKA